MTFPCFHQLKRWIEQGKDLSDIDYPTDQECPPGQFLGLFYGCRKDYILKGRGHIRSQYNLKNFVQRYCKLIRVFKAATGNTEDSEIKQTLQEVLDYIEIRYYLAYLQVYRWFYHDPVKLQLVIEELLPQPDPNNQYLFSPLEEDDCNLLVNFSFTLYDLYRPSKTIHISDIDEDQ